ncbi:MAG: translation initiation factor IF-2 [Candidatus Colwellbacteria bacterium]
MGIMALENDKIRPRPPVVAVVGHVDHGKTALLDYIRKTNIVAKEAGGITQSIGAYEVEHVGKKITFIDTPGHEAFTHMRSHGATAADIAILVVAADEGIKQQTKEALNLLKATKTPFVVAITKIDKDNANLEKVKTDLMSEEIFLEGSGGDTSWQALSSKSGEGIQELLDLILLMGEVLGLQYDPTKEARGFVIESEKDPRRGAVVHLILKDGSLKQGDDIKTLSATGKVKILENFLGKSAKVLEPSAPASIVGFDDIPKSGEEFVTGDATLEAPEPGDVVIEVITEGDGEEKPKAILKADSKGSLDALEGILKEEIEIIESSVGGIMDTDVKLAKSTGSLIVGFQVKIAKATEALAEAQEVKIFTSKIIYELLDAIKEQKDKEKQDFEGGELEVLATFNSTPNKQTVGGVVQKGKMKLNVPVEIERAGESLGRGRIKNLQQNKADVNEVGPDNECGLVIETPIPIEKGDLIKISL